MSRGGGRSGSARLMSVTAATLCRSCEPGGDGGAAEADGPPAPTSAMASSRRSKAQPPASGVPDSGSSRSSCGVVKV
jgi:hypothetical protein